MSERKAAGFQQRHEESGQEKQKRVEGVEDKMKDEWKEEADWSERGEQEARESGSSAGEKKRSVPEDHYVWRQ